MPPLLVEEQGYSHARQARGRFRPLNGIVGFCVVAIVALASVPLGSNRPFFWAFWAAVLGVLTVVYVLSLLIRNAALPVPLAAFRQMVLLYLAVCFVMLIQLTPLGGLYWGSGILTQSGMRLHPPSISVAPGETLLMLLRWLGYGLLFFLTLQVSLNPRRRLMIINALATAVTAQALLAILSYYQWGNTILGVEKWAYLDSLTGTFVNRNSLASFLALGITITTGLTLHALRTRQGSSLLTLIATYTLFMIFLVGAMLGTNSRTGLLVGVLGPLTVILCYPATIKRSRRLIWIGLPLIIAVVVAASLYGTGVWTRFFELEASGRSRSELYGQIWNMILQAPWLGYGGGSFEQAYQVFHRPPVNVELVWERTHNTYLALWCELGFIAGCLPLAIIGSITRSAILALRRTEHQDPTLPIWLAAVVIAGVHSLVDFSFEMLAVGMLFAGLGALATASALAARRTQAQS